MSEAREGTIVPPWDVDTVEALNRYQHASGMHPFTCRLDTAHVLVATRDGWRCPHGDGYEQGWAHAFMANPEAWPATWKTLATGPEDQQPGKHGPTILAPPPPVVPKPPVVTSGRAVIKP